MDTYTQELVMNHLRFNGIVDKVGNKMFNQMCEVCYRNYYRYDMDAEYAVKDAVGSVLLQEDIEIPGYDIWVA